MCIIDFQKSLFLKNRIIVKEKYEGQLHRPVTIINIQTATFLSNVSNFCMIKLLCGLNLTRSTILMNIHSDQQQFYIRTKKMHDYYLINKYL